MGRVAVVGAPALVHGWAVVGAMVVPAEDAAAVRIGWAALPADVDLVILTRAAAEAIGTDPTGPSRLLAVLP